MEEFIKHVWLAFLALVTHQGEVGGIVALAGVAYRHFTKRQNEFKNDVAVSIKRLEVLRAIDNDYGLPLVSELVDEYEKMGGNHYVHALYKKYEEKKMKETEV